MKHTKVFFGLVFVALVLASVLTSVWPVGKATDYLYIDDDDTADSVYHKLRPLTGLPRLWAVRVACALSRYDRHVRTGRYRVEGKNAVALFRALRSGTQESVHLTIPSVRTKEQLAGVLSGKLMLDSTRLVHLMNDSAFCARMGYDTCTIICLFIPNTYDVYWNLSPERLMQRMQRESKAFWTSQRRALAAAQGLTPMQVMTLASIVDEETANRAEKPRVAGMYLNRLRHNMPLQADPTIKFAHRNFALRRIYHAHLSIASPYNTYRNTGLPPGPIRVASIDGIEAVLHAEKHDYLYMCAKEDLSGTHNFARTYSEHLANAARYAHALNERGIN